MPALPACLQRQARQKWNDFPETIIKDPFLGTILKNWKTENTLCALSTEKETAIFEDSFQRVVGSLKSFFMD